MFFFGFYAFFFFWFFCSPAQKFLFLCISIRCLAMLLSSAYFYRFFMISNSLMFVPKEIIFWLLFGDDYSHYWRCPASYWSGGNVSLLSISSALDELLLNDCCSRSLCCSLSRCCFACCLFIACCARWCGENTFVCVTTGTIGNLFFATFIMWWWFVGDISSLDLFDKLSCSSLSSDSEMSSELILDRLNTCPSILTCMMLVGGITFGSIAMSPRLISLGSQVILIQLR